eukprot:CAMPEP_0197855260 /NCGR_PEP_ID=MMETSP1438-20131217/26270_1 /TAXON_ID=1461541 /ORGANISM="Pterosperma sp., Strain CCMP1384" /LENGTH=381 /DNA_ID=CAMNT_0043470299 /DNA_START=345 /DNA_END=1487 /DNA_ORIENTATION=+
MGDDLRNVPLGRQIGGAYSGAVYRGTTRALGASPVRATASIPSKFETIINVGAKELDGFNTRTHRFGTAETELPGPGTYYSRPTMVKNTDSISKKGYGSGFVSKDKRFGGVRKLQPGPGSYEHDVPQPKQGDFNKAGVTSVFASKLENIGPPLEPKVKRGVEPGPGQYDHFKSSLDPHSGKGYMYKSSTERFHKPEERKNPVPSPGQYELPKTFIGEGAAAKSSFKSSTDRPGPDGLVHGRRANMNAAPSIIYGEEDLPFQESDPGPGQYTTDVLNLSKKFKEGPKQSSMFKPSLQDRFGIPTEPRVIREEVPGPGAYSSSNTVGAYTTTTGSQSVFLSATARYQDEMSTVAGLAKPPGPAFYNPMNLGKKSFNLNARKRW